MYTHMAGGPVGQPTTAHNPYSMNMSGAMKPRPRFILEDRGISL